MVNPDEQNLNQLVIYQKSLDIFKLARHIASYISNDKSMLAMYLSMNKIDKYADNLVMNAFGLVPKIVETECEENPGLKLKYAVSIRYFIDRLYQNCLQLESTKIQGKDFVKLLRKELKKLRVIHKHYVKSLL
ncbi:MAG TPA: hypothetical protein DER05_07990 [Lutibacter sp.]|nr:hypothetical protein [Lutibacter sp.]